MTETLAFSREAEVRQDVDVFVAGGGPAGLTAAIAAARMGKSVFLAESQGAFGGMGTVGLVPAQKRTLSGIVAHPPGIL